jgi:riboflavin-specific deaminase-like protein
VVEALDKNEPDIYSSIQWPSAPEDRPYTFIDMVMTIDGRIVSGDRSDSVHDLGSKTDHQIMKRLERQADAVMIGAHTLRATSPIWNPQSQKRFVVSRSGDLPEASAFLQNGEATIVTSRSAQFDAPEGVRVLRSGAEWVDFVEFMRGLSSEGVKRLLVLGGSKLNGQLMSDDLVDEIFITIAPKVKLGKDLPTIAEGEPFDRDRLQRYSLLEHHVIGDEIFLRYRRNRD